MPSLAGRVALVTGASRGIGAATAIELARRGAHVVITGRSQGGLEETDDAIRALGGTATLLVLDLADTAALDTLGPSLFARFGKLDILVSNAGALGVLTPVPHILLKDWAEVVAVNMTATPAPDHQLRAAAADRRCRARGVSDHRPRPGPQSLLGRLRGHQSGAGQGIWC